LHHYWFDAAGDRTWKSGAEFGSNIQSEPTAFQNQNGNYEVVVREGGSLHHYWYDAIGDKTWKLGMRLP